MHILNDTSDNRLLSPKIDKVHLNFSYMKINNTTKNKSKT